MICPCELIEAMPPQHKFLCNEYFNIHIFTEYSEYLHISFKYFWQACTHHVEVLLVGDLHFVGFKMFSVTPTSGQRWLIAVGVYHY